MSIIGKPSVSSITVNGETFTNGNVTLDIPGGTTDPETGTITFPPAGGGATGTRQTFTLIAGDITNKYVILSAAPTVKQNTLFDMSGSCPQYYGTDYVITNDDAGKRFSWDGLGLESLLEVGDSIAITYF